MAELVDAPDLGSGIFGCVGSSPTEGTFSNIFKLKIMKFYNPFSSNSATMLNKSNAILSLFNKTIAKLLKLADQAKTQSAKKEEEIRKAQEEKEALDQIASNNLAMAEKFKNMISL